MMKDYPIGSIIQYGGDTLVVKATADNKPTCTKCYFSDHQREKAGKSKFSCYVHGMACTASMRKDKKHVVFIKQE